MMDERCRLNEPSGYVIAADGRSITFWPCGVTSHHPKDVAHRYCGRCHRFVEDLTEFPEFLRRKVERPAPVSRAGLFRQKRPRTTKSDA